MSYTNKTQPTTTNPKEYLKTHFAKKAHLQKEALILTDLYTKITGARCVLWNKIFGFGTYHYFDSTGGEHTYAMTGFAISSTGFTLYNLMGWEAYKPLMEHLGTYKLSGKSCLAIKRVEDINLRVLAAVVKKALADMKKRYQTDTTPKKSRNKTIKKKKV